MSLTEKQIQEARQIMASQGGLAGGPARAKSLTKKRRKAIAKKAGKARWAGHVKKDQKTA